MKNIKTIVFSILVFVLCTNADCNKVEETPVFNGYVLEGRLVNSCTDNTPLKNKAFELRDETDQIGKEIISGKTDSNGFFRIISNLNGKNLIMEDGFGIGKTILYKIPGGKSINFGDLAYNFTLGAKLIFKNYLSISINDSVLIQVSGVNPGNPYNRSFVKGPLASEDLGTIYIKESPMYTNSTTTSGEIYLYKNNLALSNLIKKNTYLVKGSCGSIQEIVF